MSALGRLAGAWLRQRSPTRQVAAWALAVVGPALLTLAALPLRSSLVLGGFLFSALLLVIASAVIGGVRPALTGVVLSVLARVIFFAPPFERGAGLEPNLVSLVAFAVVGVAVSILIGELAQLAEEQASSRQVEASLRRVATLVARAASADELFAVVTEEAGRLLAAGFARLARYEPGDWLTIIAAWGSTGDHFPIGSRWPLTGENVSSLVLQTGRPARIDNFAGISGPLAVVARELGVRDVASAPIIVQGRPWGGMIAGSVNERPLPPDTEARLASFTELVATAIANADSRAGITRLAEEQAALRRVATLVARGASADEVFAAVPWEVGQLLQADQTTMARYEPDDTATVVASWRRTGEAVPPIGDRQRLGGKNLTTIISRTRRPARIDDYADASGRPAVAAREAGFRSAAGVPVIVQGRLWGAMVACSVDEHPLPLDTEARLASFTELVATAIANAENLAELTASRARVVAAADETRRRIERDLHDGAQQQLVSLGLALQAALTAVPPQLGELKGELASVAGGLASVQEDLQEMARGIHPAVLARGGLGSALKTLARRCTIPVELDVRGSARLPERVEVAVYYLVAEALTNAAKHAHASVVRVDAEAADQIFRVCVRDDGRGGADPVRGTGLVGLKDRVEALGGTIAVHSPADAGTSLQAEFPFVD